MKKTIHSTEYHELISWLQQKRHERGLTMRELAEKLDVPHSYVGKIEQKERRLDLVEFIVYCNALDISPYDGVSIITGNSPNKR